LVAIIIAGIFLFNRAEKPKSSFQNINGVVHSLKNFTQGTTNVKVSKFRYLKINNYPETFELFVGKGLGDFKPAFEKIDAIKTGDSVSIYFEENPLTEEDSLNRLVYYIDRGNEPIFIKGGFEKYMAYFIIGISLITIIALIFLKEKGRII
jgi:hypothetical protein